ncbi:MAG: HAMP domain-containing histidine kinase [Saprospiraceae bacterium]|nr:HAMP domain-containing histidine kinase [Saprospiraceae bacterium]
MTNEEQKRLLFDLTYLKFKLNSIEAFTHDINNMFSLISFNLYNFKELFELSKDKCFYQYNEIIENLNNLETNFETLDNCVSRILALSTEKSNSKKGNYQLKALLDDVVELFLLRLKNHKIKLEVKCEQSNSINIYQQDFIILLQNVLNNSVKALECINRQDKEITIECHEIEMNTFLNVYDNGSGIAQENMSKIFDIGFTTYENSSGIGLALVKSIVDYNYGSIKISSQLGKWTEVSICFPKY